MNFYLNLVNAKFRDEGHNPALGLILCRERNDVIVDHSLNGIDSPIAVSDHRPNILPPEIAQILPAPKEVEAKLVALITEDDAETDDPNDETTSSS